jgi:VanZ family protein
MFLAILAHLRAPLLWAAFILVLVLMPAPAIPGGGWLGRYHVDKLVHAILFAVFFILLARAFRDLDPAGPARRHALLVALVISVAYGLLTELLQELTSWGRHGELGDMVANTIGSLIGVMVVWLAGRRTEAPGA